MQITVFQGVWLLLTQVPKSGNGIFQGGLRIKIEWVWCHRSQRATQFGAGPQTENTEGNSFLLVWEGCLDHHLHRIVYIVGMIVLIIFYATGSSSV